MAQAACCNGSCIHVACAVSSATRALHWQLHVQAAVVPQAPRCRAECVRPSQLQQLRAVVASMPPVVPAVLQGCQQ